MRDRTYILAQEQARAILREGGIHAPACPCGECSNAAMTKLDEILGPRWLEARLAEHKKERRPWRGR